MSIRKRIPGDDSRGERRDEFHWKSVKGTAVMRQEMEKVAGEMRDEGKPTQKGSDDGKRKKIESFIIDL
jgi:hypothetical protein